MKAGLARPLDQTETRLILPAVLRPFIRAEAITVPQASKRAGRTDPTIRGWCARYHIGRHVAGGQWFVSVVALAMLLENDWQALDLYLKGNRTDPRVLFYYRREGVPLPGASVAELVAELEAAQREDAA